MWQAEISRVSGDLCSSAQKIITIFLMYAESVLPKGEYFKLRPSPFFLRLPSNTFPNFGSVVRSELKEKSKKKIRRNLKTIVSICGLWKEWRWQEPEPRSELVQGVCLRPEAGRFVRSLPIPCPVLSCMPIFVGFVSFFIVIFFYLLL